MKGKEQAWTDTRFPSVVAVAVTGVEESFKAKIKRREAALDAFAVAEAYCKGIGMVSRCEREGFDGFIIDLCSDAEDETIRLVRLVADSEEGIMDDVFRLEYGSCEFKI